MRHLYFLSNLTLSAALTMVFLSNTPCIQSADFTTGAIVINENQYGKSDSSINHLSIGDAAWSYGIFSSSNPGHALGGTACSGGYDASTLYVVCKDVGYPGTNIEGGILTAMNASDVSLRWQLKNLDPSGKRAAGRGFLAINDSKAYVSSSNGIWVINTVEGSVLRQIAGTENPSGVDDKPITDPTSTLYTGQCGSMVKLNGKVFAAHQENGLMVINPDSDLLERTISMDIIQDGAGIGSVVAGSDGNLWFSISDNTDGYGIPLNKLGKLDPVTLEISTIDIPTGMFGPSQSWAAWTPDTFCSSPDGFLYWTGGEDIWYSNMLVFRHEITSGETILLLDFNDNEDGWKVCTPSMRVDPSSNLLYITLFKDFASTEYTLRSYTSAGVEAKDYPMKRAYWFCGTILFPESAMAGIENVATPVDQSDFSVRYSNGIISFTGISDGDALIFDMQGRITARVPLSNEGTTSARVSLPSGIYMAACPHGVSKFMVK